MSQTLERELRATGIEWLDGAAGRARFRLKRLKPSIHGMSGGECPNAWEDLKFDLNEGPNPFGDLWQVFFDIALANDLRILPVKLGYVVTFSALWQLDEYERYREWMEEPFRDQSAICSAIESKVKQLALGEEFVSPF